MYNFEYHRPNTVRKAASMLDKMDEATLLAGGQTLLSTMKQRLAAPENLIDIGGVDGMDEIKLKGRTLHVGAMARHADVASSDDVQQAIPALAALAGAIGDPHVRNMGTIGGSLANNDPNADYPAAVLGLNATIHTNKRKISADEFFEGLFETALKDEEIITKVTFPVPRKAGYAKFPNPASRFALVGVFVSKKGREVRVAVTGAGADGVFRAGSLEEALSTRFNAKSLEGASVGTDGMSSDIHASADYRAHLVGVMAKRAVASS